MSVLHALLRAVYTQAHHLHQCLLTAREVRGAGAYDPILALVEAWYDAEIQGCGAQRHTQLTHPPAGQSAHQSLAVAQSDAALDQASLSLQAAMVALVEALAPLPLYTQTDTRPHLTIGVGKLATSSAATGPRLRLGTTTKAHTDQDPILHGRLLVKMDDPQGDDLARLLAAAPHATGYNAGPTWDVRKNDTSVPISIQASSPEAALLWAALCVHNTLLDSRSISISHKEPAAQMRAALAALRTHPIPHEAL